MKVYELIEALQNMPQNAEVFAYSYYDEGDINVDGVKLCRQYYKSTMDGYYCQGDSFAASYLTENQNETEVVVIGSFW